jgi:hypothetical protein
LLLLPPPLRELPKPPQEAKEEEEEEIEAEASEEVAEEAEEAAEEVAEEVQVAEENSVMSGPLLPNSEDSLR